MHRSVTEIGLFSLWFCLSIIVEFWLLMRNSAFSSVLYCVSQSAICCYIYYIDSELDVIRVQGTLTLSSSVYIENGSVITTPMCKLVSRDENFNLARQ